MELRDSFYSVDGHGKWYSHYGEQYGGSLKKQIKTELPYNPAVPLLGIYPEENMIQKDTCTPMFITALFTIAKTWKQPKGALTEEWIKKMCYAYIYIYTHTHTHTHIYTHTYMIVNCI